MDHPPSSTVHRGPEPSIPGVTDLTPVGHGGFGTVYRGRQAAFDRDVAVKVLSGVAVSDAAAAGWRREVAAMGRLSNHPNIVPVYDSGVTDGGLPYLVMPFVPGGTLADVVGARGPLTPPEVAALTAKLAGALTTAHGLGVLHRDVKPANVLLSPYGEPQLTDFGIAHIDDTTTTGVGTEALALTVAYAAPEVLNGEPATARSDIYSLSATAYFLLTGTPPFVSSGEQPLVALVLRITTEAPPDLRNSGVPDALARVIEGGLAKDPGDRPSDATDLQHQLDAAARELGARDDDTIVLPITAPALPGPRGLPATQPIRRVEVPAAPPVTSPSTTWPDASRRRPRNGRGALLAVLGLLVLATAAALLLTRGDDADPQGDVAGPSTAPTDAAEPVDTDAPPTSASGEQRTAPPSGADVGDLDDAARTYLDTLADGDLDAAFAMLSPAMQGSQPRSSFDAFWGGLDSIEIVGDLRVEENDAAVTVPVAFDGAREDYRLTFVPDGHGGWLVDGPRPG